MLPIPFSKWIPQAFQSGEDPARDAFCARMDALLEDLSAETKQVAWLKDPARMSGAALEAAGEMLAADILTSDTEAVRRQKIATAIERQKLSGTWPAVKALIDAYVGGDAKLVDLIGTDDWILSDGSDTYWWAGIGGVSASLDYGIRVVGGTSEPEGVVKGTVLIDVDDPALTADEVAHLVEVLTIPLRACMAIFIGYTTGTVFTVYAPII